MAKGLGSRRMEAHGYSEVELGSQRIEAHGYIEVELGSRRTEARGCSEVVWQLLRVTGCQAALDLGSRRVEAHGCIEAKRLGERRTEAHRYIEPRVGWHHDTVREAWCTAHRGAWIQQAT